MKVYSSEGEAKDSFEHLEKVDLKALPKEQGFYVYRKSAATIFYIAASETLTTPKGNPIVFSYDKNPLIGCAVKLSTKNISFWLTQIKPEHYPVDKWPLLYKRFATLVDSLIIQDESENHEL